MKEFLTTKGTKDYTIDTKGNTLCPLCVFSLCTWW